MPMTAFTQATTVKLLNPKQMLQFDMQKNVYFHKIDLEMKEFIKMMSKAVNVRTKWLQYSD